MTETDEPGVYRAEGVRIERNGEWLFYFEIEAEGQRGRVTTSVEYSNSELP